MVYIIISIVLALIVIGCLKSKFSEGVIPICVFCFGISALVTSGVVVYDFFMHPEKHKIKPEITTTYGEFSIDKDKKDTYDFKRDTDLDYSVTTKAIVKDTATFVETTSHKLIHSNKNLVTNLCFEIKSEDTIHLSPKDYAVYEAYKNSVDKRR